MIKELPNILWITWGYLVAQSHFFNETAQASQIFTNRTDFSYKELRNNPQANHRVRTRIDL